MHLSRGTSGNGFSSRNSQTMIEQIWVRAVTTSPPFWRPRPLGPSPPKEHHGRRGCWCLLASETTPGQRLADDGPLARGRAETPWPSWPSLSVSYARWLALVPAVCFSFFCFALLTVDNFTQNDYKRELRLPRKGVPHKTVPLGKA